MGSNTVDVFVKTDADLLTISHKGNTKKLLGYELGEKILVKNLQFKIGGSATNAAVTFARQQLKTGYLGKIGDDNNGVKVFKNLKKENIKFVGAIGKQTGYSVILESNYKDRTILTYKGSNNKLKYEELDLKKINAKWFYFTTMMEDSFETMKKLSKKLKKEKKKIAFNPSSYLATKGYEELDSLLKYVDVLVLNKEEASLLSKQKTINKMLKSLKKHVNEIVIITDAGNGASLYDGKHKYSGKPKKVGIKETTGAGDAFASGFLSSHIRKKPLAEAFKSGFLQSESVIQHLGATNNILNKEELDKRLAEDTRSINKQKI